MPTIKDVARLAGVGLGTASRVVNGKGSVSPATRAKVQAAIDELGFRPSHPARALLLGLTQTIGVYIPILKGTFYTPILQVIDNELRAGGRHMTVAFGYGAGDQRRQALEGVEFLIERGCDGLIVMSNALQDEDIVALAAKQPNLVVLNRVFPSLPDACFCADHTEGGRLAAQALLKAGHRSFAIIAGPATSPDNVERIEAFLAELKKKKIDTAAIPMLSADFSPEGGFHAMRSLLDAGARFTALFCANDEMAVGALSCLHEAGIKVPQDLSVLGYDDTHAAEYSAPPLTSVHIPLREVTLNGLNWLLNRTYGLAHPISREFTVSVTRRASVAEVDPAASAALATAGSKGSKGRGKK